jgi:fermentation-respiration switch protein FrsA (DUF1100 family)
MRSDVEFTSAGETVRGWLYTPEEGEPPYPVVVMAGGWCYVKELIQPHYAKYFVDAGFAVLLFDYRNFGASDGARRQHIDPSAQIEDYKNAVSFAETLEVVDGDRIALWGISYSGGHVLISAATDPRVKCIVSQIPVVDGYRNMRRVHGTLGFSRFRELLLEDRRRRFATGEGGTLPHAAADNVAELATWPFPETFTTFKALRKSEAPAYRNASTIESAELLMSYSVMPFLPRLLDVPTLMIVAEDDDLTLWDLEIEAYNAIPTAKKRLVVIGGSTHMTLYSDQSLLARAGEAAAAWFSENLLAGTPVAAGAAV